MWKHSGILEPVRLVESEEVVGDYRVGAEPGEIYKPSPTITTFNAVLNHGNSYPWIRAKDCTALELAVVKAGKCISNRRWTL